MFSKCLEKRFSEMVEGKQGLSASAMEKLLKSEGIIITRKNIAVLVGSNLVSQPEVVTYSSAPNGDRKAYSFENAQQLVAYSLALEACGVKGLYSENRMACFRYVKEALSEAKPTDIITFARINSMMMSSHFVKSNSTLSSRLELAKEASAMLRSVFYFFWFTSGWILGSKDFNILQAWRSIREQVFREDSLIRFSGKIRTDITEESKSELLTIKNIKDIAIKVCADKEAKESLRTWLEILMMFTGGTKFIVDEAESFMLEHHGIKIDLHSDTVFSIITLYKLLK